MSETVISLNQSSTPSHHVHHQNDPSNLNWIQFNVNYFKTTDGILKIIQMVLAIICMTLASPAFLGGTHFFLFAIVITFIGTVLWSFFIFLGIKDVLNLPINWALSEFVNYFISTVLLFIAFVVQLAIWFGREGQGTSRNITAGFIAIFDTIAYAASAYLLYLQYKFSRST